MNVTPLAEALVALTLMFLPFWLLWRATQWACPLTADLTTWFVRQLRHLMKSLARWLHRSLWQRPTAHYGTAVALWLVFAAVLTVGLIAIVLSGRLVGLLGLLPWIGLLVGYWFLLRWWRSRIYRPRPLPRRRRHRDG